MSKKVLAVVLWCLVVVVGAFAYITNNTKEVEAMENAVDSTVVIAREMARKRIDNTTEVCENVVKKEEKELFNWVKNSRQYDIIGTLKSNDIVLETGLAFGGENEALLNRACGIHNQLSNNKHLTILGHNCEKVNRLKDKLFSHIKELKKDNIVEMDTIFGKYILKVTDTIYVSPEEYFKDGYACLLEGDVAFASCEWHGEEKGRRIVYFDVIDIIHVQKTAE